MKLKSAILLSLFLIAIITVAGCTTTPGGPTATTTPTTTAAPTTTTTQPSGPGPSVTYEPCSRDTVSGQKLQGELPSAQSGGQAGDPYFMMMQVPGEDCQYAWAMNEYTHDDCTVDVMIYDFNYYTGVYGAAWGYAYQSSTGYAKEITIKGYYAWEVATITPGSEDILLWVDIGNGILVWIYVDCTSDTGLLYQYANAIDYFGIDALV